MRQFILGDCMDEKTGLPSYPDKFFDLAIVDPPYGIGEFYNQPYSGRPHNRAWKIAWNDAPPEKNYFEQVYRVSKNQIIWGSNYYIGHIRNIGAIVWDKGNNSGIGSACEIASQSFDKRVVKVFLQNTGFVSQERGQKIHQCQKPVALYRWLLENYAKPGQLILDTHVGSASSLIACESMGFDYVGFEIDPDYYAAAKNRMSKGIQAVLM